MKKTYKKPSMEAIDYNVSQRLCDVSVNEDQTQGLPGANSMSKRISFTSDADHWADN